MSDNIDIDIMYNWYLGNIFITHQISHIDKSEEWYLEVNKY